MISETSFQPFAQLLHLFPAHYLNGNTYRPYKYRVLRSLILIPLCHISPSIVPILRVPPCSPFHALSVHSFALNSIRLLFFFNSTPSRTLLSCPSLFHALHRPPLAVPLCLPLPRFVATGPVSTYLVTCLFLSYRDSARWYVPPRR